MVIDKINGKINYFHPGLQKEADKRAGAEICNNYSRVNTCFH